MTHPDGWIKSTYPFEHFRRRGHASSVQSPAHPPPLFPSSPPLVASPSPVYASNFYHYFVRLFISHSFPFHYSHTLPFPSSTLQMFEIDVMFDLSCPFLLPEGELQTTGRKVITRVVRFVQTTCIIQQHFQYPGILNLCSCHASLCICQGLSLSYMPLWGCRTGRPGINIYNL